MSRTRTKNLPLRALREGRPQKTTTADIAALMSTECGRPISARTVELIEFDGTARVEYLRALAHIYGVGIEAMIDLAKKP